MQRLFNLTGHTAVVTGASSGIGQTIAEALARAGAAVVLVARRAERLENIARAIESKSGKAAPVSLDLAKVENWAEIASELRLPFGNPDILINAAGINLREQADLISASSWNRTIHLNLSVPFFLAQAMISGDAN